MQKPQSPPFYQAEFIELHNSFFGNSIDNKDYGGSRRVILDNLPPDTNSIQVLEGVKSQGVVSISLLPTKTLSLPNTNSALVEFVNDKAATVYVKALDLSSIWYKDKHGTAYEAKAWLVPTPSFPLAIQYGLPQRKIVSRAIFLARFPEKWVWYFLCTVGHRNVTAVTHRKDDPAEVYVEFTSVFAATRAMRLIENGDFDFYQPGKDDVGYAADNSQAPVYLLFYNKERHGFPFVDPHIIEKTWNVIPYNLCWPTQHVAVMRLEGLPPRQEDFRACAIEKIFADSSKEREDDENGHAASENDSTSVRAVGDSTESDDRKWQFSKPAAGKAKLLMIHTLHDPEWEKAWDAYFESQCMPNLRKYDKYGRLAKHRCQSAAEQNVPKGELPPCVRSCEYGCSDIKETPTPDFIKKYVQFEQ